MASHSSDVNQIKTRTATGAPTRVPSVPRSDMNAAITPEVAVANAARATAATARSEQEEKDELPKLVRDVGPVGWAEVHRHTVGKSDRRI
jgi:hypothetical protein